MTIYKTLIRPILTYAVKTMTITKKDEERRKITETKSMRVILGPIRTADSRRSLQNENEFGK